MKKFNRILCCLFAFLILISFSACKKKETNNTNNTNNNQQQQTNPDINNPPEGPDDPNPPQTVVALTSSEMLDLCSTMTSSFFNDYEFDNESDFDNFISENKILFLNTSNLIKKIDDCDDIVEDFEFNKWLKGSEIVRDSYTSQVPSLVSKFKVQYNNYQEDATKKANAVSSIEISVLFGYHELDNAYTYDFYNIYLETSNLTKDISVKCYIEKAVASGISNSSATYYAFDFAGQFGEESSVDDFNFYKFDRSEKITNTATMININYISNYEQASFDGENEVYFDPANTNATINTAGSENKQVQVIKDIIDWVNGKYNTAFNATTGRARTDLSETLVPFDNSSTEVE